MPHLLSDTPRGDESPSSFLQRVGEVFAVFDRQDSGNVSYGVRVGGDRLFVKTVGDPADPRPHLPFDERVGLLRNAVELAGRVHHPALATLETVVESAAGPLLVYRWADGDLVGAHRGERDHPTGAFQRFRSLPLAEIRAVLARLYDLHVALAGDGWVAVDLYDGCLIYDFETAALTVIDLDTYHRGPLTNRMGRMFGSDRTMAPEEFVLGATIDQRTTLFTLARIGQVLLSAGADGTYDAASFRGSPTERAVLDRATVPDPGARFDTVEAFASAWAAAG